MFAARHAAGLNNEAGIRIVTPDVLPPEGGMSGTPVDEGGVRDHGGYYMTPWPLSEKYFLVAYSYSNAAPQGAPDHYRGMDETGYALYLIDAFGNKKLIYRDPTISCFTPIPLRPRTRPPVLPDSTDSTTPFATCTLTDAAFGSDGIDPGQVRHLRIAQPVPWPYDERYGGQRYETVALREGLNWTPVAVLGTVPVERDGSAHFRVPADTAVYFQLLDEDFLELRRMRSFISLQPGERRGCVGCHESQAVAPIATAGLLALERPPSIPTPPPWGVRPLNFLRDVQHPERSLFLAAPLATAPEGPRCEQPPYADALDADYVSVRKLLETAVRRAWSNPRRDLRGLLTHSP